MKSIDQMRDGELLLEAERLQLRLVEILEEQERRNKIRCSICGSPNSLDGILCQHLCFWIVEGWVGWNARLNEVRFFTSQGLELWSLHRQSYPKMNRTARDWGWTGRENVVGTFPRPVIVMPRSHRLRRAA